LDNPAIIVLVTAVLAAILTFVLVKVLDKLRLTDAENKAKEIVHRAEREIENRRKEAELGIKEEALRQKTEGEKDLHKQRQELHERDRMLDKRQDALEDQAEQLRKQEKMVESNQRKLMERLEDTNRRHDELGKLLDLQRQTLHQLSGLSKEEATHRLLDMLDQELANEVGTRIHKHEKRMAELAEEKSREILITAVQRYASSHTAESTTSMVDIPSDDMKGRIIGREGRNIRAFEKATGVDVIIDDTPGVVIVSCFDPVRREIARQSLAKLIADGRIHPARIEEVAAETQKELEGHLQRLGEEACEEADVHGLKENIVHLLGRLHFRTSYSQNVLRHSIEVAYLTGMMAEELGMDGKLARRAGLLHDIGKAADHEAEGGNEPASEPKSSTRHSDITTICGSTTPTRCSSRPPMPPAPPGPGPVVSRWSGTSSGWKNWRRSPAVFRASSKRLPFRRGANCASSPVPKTRRTLRPPRSAATSPTPSSSNSRIPARSK
jgi:ribonuclease Y